MSWAGLSAISSATRSEEHTSELQSLRHLVCRLLLEKKNGHPRERGALRNSRCLASSGGHPARHAAVARGNADRQRAGRPSPYRSLSCFFFLMIRRPPRSPLFPYPTLFRSSLNGVPAVDAGGDGGGRISFLTQSGIVSVNTAGVGVGGGALWDPRGIFFC